jgi:hypothetical protein
MLFSKAVPGSPFRPAPAVSVRGSSSRRSGTFIWAPLCAGVGAKPCVDFVVDTSSTPTTSRSPATRHARSVAGWSSMPPTSSAASTSFSNWRTVWRPRGFVERERMVLRLGRNRPAGAVGSTIVRERCPVTRLTTGQARSTFADALRAPSGVNHSLLAAMRPSLRLRIQLETSSSIHATTFAETRLCRGNWPCRSRRQIVERDNPVRSRTVGKRISRGTAGEGARKSLSGFDAPLTSDGRFAPSRLSCVANGRL